MKKHKQKKDAKNRGVPSSWWFVGGQIQSNCKIKIREH
jgi:hypothetical protein